MLRAQRGSVILKTHFHSMCGSDQSSTSSPRPPQAKDICVQATVAHLHSSHCHSLKTLLTLCLLSLSLQLKAASHSSFQEREREAASSLDRMRCSGEGGEVDGEEI